MGKALRIVTELTADDFRRLIRREPDGRVRQRLTGMLHLRQGKGVPQAAEAIQLNERKLRNWVHRFNSEGIDGLRDRRRSGRRSFLTPEQKASFRARIESGPTEADGVVRFRWQDMQRILREEYGADYKAPWSVLKMVHSLGISWLSCRPAHPQGDVEKRNAFKKNAS
jgi:transposase